MLSWSATETNRSIDLRGIVDGTTPIGIDGGLELVGVGASAVGSAVDPGPVAAVAEVLGEEAAVRAAAVAGAFELYNRIVDATGLPVGEAQRRQLAGIIDTLGLDAFPHAGHGL